MFFCFFVANNANRLVPVWLFSSKQISVMVGDGPSGPWSDPLGKPLLDQAYGKSLNQPTHIRDPGVLQDDDGGYYLVFGDFEYYVVRFGDDMISLAEEPRHITVIDALGTQGPNKTDDKPFLHKRANMYYLSWGSFYGIGESPYGRFKTLVAFMDTEHIA